MDQEHQWVKTLEDIASSGSPRPGGLPLSTLHKVRGGPLSTAQVQSVGQSHALFSECCTTHFERNG